MEPGQDQNGKRLAAEWHGRTLCLGRCHRTNPERIQVSFFPYIYRKLTQQNIGSGSFCVGVDNIAEGVRAMCFGDENVSHDINTFSFGKRNVAYNQNTVAIGTNNQVNGIGATAIGNRSLSPIKLTS